MKSPWSTNQLKRLGDALRDEAILPTSLLDYADVVAWYDELAASVQNQIAELNLGAIGGVGDVQISSRAKTIETLRDKLRREWPIRLPSIQDLAGVRVVADMSLHHQDEIARRIVDAFGHDQTAIHDLRASPHSGYRAVHVWLRLEGGRVEVQVRTSLQSRWANLYEALADIAGREIRYGGQAKWPEGAPKNLRNFGGVARLLSEREIDMIEKTRLVVDWWSKGSPAGQDELATWIEYLRSDWARHPVLKGRPAPKIDPNSPDAPKQMADLLSEIEVATATMMDDIRDELVRIRAEIQRGET